MAQDITIQADRITLVEKTVGSYNKGNLSIELEGVDEDNLLESISISDVVSHYGAGELLDEIGRDEAVEHFKIEEKE